MPCHKRLCVGVNSLLHFLQGESDDDAAMLSGWISTGGKDKSKASKESQAASDSAAAPPRSTSQHNLAASSHSSLTGVQLSILGSFISSSRFLQSLASLDDPELFVPAICRCCATLNSRAWLISGLPAFIDV